MVGFLQADRISVFLLTAALVYMQEERISNDPINIQISSHEIASIRINPVDSSEMVYIPSGEFLMGSDMEEIDIIWNKFHWNPEEKAFTKGEQPAHRVRVDRFWVYRNLVTVAQYQNFCDATGRQMPDPPSYGWKESHPIVKVTWWDAKAYCEWAGGRLPYEAEWEFAARGGKTGIRNIPRTIFVWGDFLPIKPVANLADVSFMQSGYYDSPGFHFFHNYKDGYSTSSPVNAFQPNGYGLTDMAGNVLEWCEDWYSEEYYLNSPIDNPHGPMNGDRRVLRGGAFDTTPTITRIARRLGNYPNIRHEEKGFRCVHTP